MIQKKPNTYKHQNNNNKVKKIEIHNPWQLILKIFKKKDESYMRKKQNIQRVRRK